MDKNFTTQIVHTEISSTQGYNHTISVHQVDITTFGLGPLHVNTVAKFTGIIKAMLESEGTGMGCYVSYVQSVDSQGLVGQIEQPNPYNNDNKQIYGTFRFVVTVRTSGSD